MKRITIVCLFITLFTSSFAFGADYLGTFCWVDNEGDVLELAVSDVGDGTNYPVDGVYYDDAGLISPTTGNLTYVGGSVISGVITTSDRSGSMILDVIGHIELNATTLHGTLWGVPRGTNMNTGLQYAETEILTLTNYRCP